MGELIIVVPDDRDHTTQSQLHGISTTSLSLLELINASPNYSQSKTLKTARTSPMKTGIAQILQQDEWLPISESRRGNAYYAAFHILSSGIGVQALLLPLAFTALGWARGIICLSIAFVWQLYTIWILVQLHESPAGTRYSRYLHLAITAFGEKLGKALALLPTTYLAGGTCVALIVLGGGAMRLFFETVMGDNWDANSLTLTEWYLVFTCSAVVLAQLPNLNSIAGVSLVGAITAVSYCTLVWVLSLVKGKPSDHFSMTHKINMISDVAKICRVLNALGIIAFAFRGHNLVLEIQGTMPSSPKNPSRVPMWRAVKYSYVIIALCLFPLAIGGYWAYGDLMPSNVGMLKALYKYHEEDASKVILGLTSLLVVVNSLTSFQIYAMPVFDNFEFRYTSNANRPCPWWLRTGLRVFFGGLAFLVAVALPFLQSLAGLLGGISLPVTLAYPCFMWIRIKKPNKYTLMWYLNWLLGCLGMILSILLVFAATWTMVNLGLQLHFFKPYWQMMQGDN